MQILTATPTDIPELTLVEMESIIQSFPNPEPYSIDPAQRQYQWQTYFAGQTPVSARPERVVFKAMADGKMIGLIAGQLTTRFNLDAELQKFFILKEYQRQGVGMLLLNQLLLWLRSYNVKSLCVGIAPTNPYRQFYLKHGGKYLNEHWIVWDDIGR